MNPPSPRPCASCPYRRDVASGVWAAEEYRKLARYDNDTPDQPAAVFSCHQTDRDSDTRRVCAGWAGCHDGDNLLALRIGILEGVITPETAHAVVNYTSPVPLFATGAEAAAHGLADIDRPGEQAHATIAKIRRVRSDLQT